MTTNQPEPNNDRLNDLENRVTNIEATVVEHHNNIDVLVANIIQLTENINILTEQTTRNVNNLAEQAAQDRQQAAIDRQEFRNRMDNLAQQAAIDRQETQRIWEYLRDRNGGSNTPT